METPNQAGQSAQHGLAGPFPSQDELNPAQAEERLLLFRGEIYIQLR